MTEDESSQLRQNALDQKKRLPLKDAENLNQLADRPSQGFIDRINDPFEVRKL